MSEPKTADQPDSRPADQSGLHKHPVDYKEYLWRCICVFIAILAAVCLMVWISYLPERYTWAAKVAMILAVAGANALVVAGFLMHLVSEKKMIYTVLGFTVIFVIGLFLLTIAAMKDFPPGTAFH